MGKKTSVWLGADLLAGWKASGLSLAELVRRGLEMDAPGRPLDESTLRRVVREVVGELLREDLPGLLAPADRGRGGYSGDFDYEREAYLQDP